MELILEQRLQKSRVDEDQLIDYADGLLDESTQVVEHLDTCAPCQRRVNALQDSLTLTRSIWQENLAQIQDIQPTRSRRSPWKGMRAAAAGILLGIGLFWASHLQTVSNEAASPVPSLEQIDRDITQAIVVAEKFYDFYDLRTVVIPPHKPCIRTDFPDLIFAHGRAKVKALGGLHVIGTRRFESRRIDNQLRGRSGRQGDPDSSQFFIALDDELIQHYGLQDSIPQSCGDEQSVADRRVSQEIARAQRIIEDQNFQIRKLRWKYSTLLEQHREVIFKKRDDLLYRNKTLHLLERHLPQRFAQLRASVSEEVLAQCERDVALYQIDRAWSYYLAEVEHLRMFIHVRSLDGCDPLGEFHKAIARAFYEMQARMNDSILDTLRDVAITENGIDFEEAGLKTPAATWTYIINDNPLGNWSQRLRSSVKRMVKEKLFRWTETWE